MRHPHRPLAAALAATVMAGLLAAGPTGSAAASPAPDATRLSAAAKYQRQAFRVTNNKRENHDLREFRRTTCLQKYAVKNARRMANREVMEHQDLGPMARDCGLSHAAENIAEGYPTGRAVVKAWMGSPDHRANILNRKYRLMAVAARKGDNGRWYAAQVFGRKA